MASERLTRWALGGAALLVFAIGPVLLVVLGWGLWAAAPSSAPGLAASVAGTAATVLVALAVAVVVGVGAGVYVAEYPEFGATMLRDLVHDLSGLPSVVHGVFGLAVFSGLMGLGQGPLAVGLTLSLVALPGIVGATEEAVTRVPGRRREAALALGATRWQVVVQVVLPGAGRGIAGGVVGAAARVAGEAAPLLVLGVALAGMVPSRLFSLAADPGREAFALALGLAAVTAALSWGASVLRARARGLT